MDPTKYVDSDYGSPHIQPGDSRAFHYYLPKPLPRRIAFSSELVSEISAASAALGELNGLATLMPNPRLLIAPYEKREALASSRIEGTRASLSEVFEAEVSSEDATDDVKEVNRYLQATRKAMDLLRSLPIVERMLKEVHRELLTGVRGEDRQPGVLRTSPVWIGSANDTPSTAPFVPPLPEHIGPLLSDWETFVNEDGRTLPAVVHAAMMHYQFETIHPFLDGNGRIGRLLINVLFKDRDVLRYPVLYLSHYFEEYREEYYSALQGVRERGDMETWLTFFCRAVTSQSTDAVKRSRALIELMQGYRSEAKKAPRSRLGHLVDVIGENPYLTVKSVAGELDMTEQGARNLLRMAEGEEFGWVRSQGTRGRGGREHWVAHEFLAIVEAPRM
ncbi:Fic family protein [Corynebacterium sp.]|uniref:Fic family protein n=1 Tax=Corynebacterium sp. TaxID=1720 RepID=UPI0026DBCE77|nr:Fic/DOC family N-terminal domain-containing protein [Corynebacterium sp.]MDO4609681.1 Fic/DOC family N-terminal domain-containing protein [Corynebacterium sp.]